jgi:hypothetical protein
MADEEECDLREALRKFVDVLFSIGNMREEAMV